MRKRWLKTSALMVVAAGLVGSDYAKAEESLGNDIFYDALFGIMHIRENEDFLGHKNETNFRVTPNIAIGNFVFEGDFTYGKGSTNSSAPRDKIAHVVNMHHNLFNVKTKPADDKYAEKWDTATDDEAKRKVWAEALTEKGKKELLGRMADRPRFYRNFTRVTYENEASNFKITAGDAAANVTFGSMQGPSGAGISLYRTSSMFDRKAQSTLNCQSTITILRPSFVEVTQNGSTIQGKLFAPGIYSLADIAPEVNLHDTELIITDDFNHKYTYKVNVHGDKVPLAENTDEFEFRIFVPHRFDALDPMLRKYGDNVIFSGVYRFAYSGDLTLQANAQGYNGGVKAETGYSCQTRFGLFSQAVGASFANGDGSRRAMSTQFYYLTPQMPIGTVSVAFGIIGKGYIDLGLGADQDDINKQIWDFVSSGNHGDYTNPFQETTKKTLTVKYTPCEIFKGIGISAFYKKEWEDHRAKQSGDISLTWVYKNKYKFASGIGITVDKDGRLDKDGASIPTALKADEIQRRFYVAVDIPVCDQVSLTSSYDYDDERMFYASMEFKPEAVEGLTVELDSKLHGGYGEWRAHGGKVKYECKYADFRFDHQITMRKSIGMHKNRERFFANTYIKNGEFMKKPKGSFLLYNSKKDLKSKKD